MLFVFAAEPGRQQCAICGLNKGRCMRTWKRCLFENKLRANDGGILANAEQMPIRSYEKFAV